MILTEKNKYGYLIKKAKKWGLYGLLIWLCFVGIIIWQMGGLKSVVDDPLGGYLFNLAGGVAVIILLIPIIIAILITLFKMLKK